MKSKLLKVLFTIALFGLFCQGITAQGYDQQAMQLQFINNYGNIKNTASKDPRGSALLFEEWKIGDVVLNDTVVARFDQVRLDLNLAILEVLYKGQENSINNRNFKRVEVIEGKNRRLFIPANRFQYNGTALNGFMEQVGAGEAATIVLIHHYVEIKPPTPTANITGGPTVDTWIKEKKTYFFKDNQLTPIKTKKDVQAFYSRQSKKLDTYLKQQKPNVKDPQELYQLVMHMEK
jgi:hypothetical protein